MTLLNIIQKQIPRLQKWEAEGLAKALEKTTDPTASDLLKYAGHLGSCNFWNHDNARCTCGFEELRKTVEDTK